MQNDRIVLLNCAYGLAIRFNNYVILQDLTIMTETELLGVVLFLTRLKDS